MTSDFHCQGSVTPIDSIVTLRPQDQNFDQLFLAFDGTFTEVYGRMRSDSTPSRVYGLTSAVAVVTIESMGMTPPADCEWQRKQ